MKSDVLTTDTPTDINSSSISSIREEIEYLSEENQAKTLIIKKLTEIKTTVNPISTLVTCNQNSTDKTTQNSNNVTDKTIQNNNQQLKKKKYANKNLSNTKTLSTIDTFTSSAHVLSIPYMQRTQAWKTRRMLMKRKTRKKRKKIIAMGLQIKWDGITKQQREQK